MDEFLDVVELFVKVLETRVGLLTLRVRLGANKLFFDPLLHLLQQIAVRLLTRWLVKMHFTSVAGGCQHFSDFHVKHRKAGWLR